MDFVDPDDPNNPVEALRDMVDAMPCARPTGAPLFTVTGDCEPLLPAAADSAFAALARAALGDAAETVSLHSMRVQLACALKAVEASDAHIQAFARWKTPESVQIYGRFNPTTYAEWLRRAAAARTTSRQVQHLPQYDDDEAHIAMDDTIAAVRTPEFEDSCAPVSDPESDGDGGSAPSDASVDDGADSSDADSAAGAATPAKRRRRSALSNDTKISVVQQNPKRPGSKSHARFEMYKHARTRAQYIEAGGTTADFAYDLEHGFVTPAGTLGARDAA